MMQNILKTFLNNTIVILPQTIFYESSESGEKLIQKDIKLFSSVKNLTICAREKNSFLLLQNRFNNINSILIPDMVCYFEPLRYQRKRDGVLFCRRNDKEKIILEVEFKELLETINSCNIQNIQYTDTVICQDILPQDRENVVFNKINEFSQYELIITDRLHGMVLAALANTPCIALGNCNYKISGVYEWIKNNQFIKFADSIEIADKFILEILNDKSKYKYDNVSLKAYFNTLSDLIKQEMCGE